MAHSQSTWETAKEKTVEARASLERAVVKGVGAVQDMTGLKLREGLGLAQSVSEDVMKKAEEQGREVAKKVEQGTQEVKTVVEKKVEEVKRLV